MACRGGGQGHGAAAHGWVAARANVCTVVDERMRRVVHTNSAGAREGAVADWSAAEALGEAGVEAVGVVDLGGVGLVAFFFDGQVKVPHFFALQLELQTDRA